VTTSDTESVISPTGVAATNAPPTVGGVAGGDVLRPRQLSETLALFPVRSPTLLPATHTNTYALGSRDVVLVEPATPYEDELRAYVEWVRGLVSAGRRPIAIFATHHHPDHVGGVAQLARELDLPLWAHAETASRVPAWETARKIVDGEELVLDGPVPSKWKALHTPGHAPGHLCLHDEASGDILVGDMVATVGTILILPGDGFMQSYIQQLERLAKLVAQRALPAHGEPIGDPTAHFRMYIAHRLMREGKVRDALQKAGKPATASELLPVAYEGTPPGVMPIALLSLRAHLDKLVADGEARVIGGGAEEEFALVSAA
jgi:ribonuclease/clavin/mitogillin